MSDVPFQQYETIEDTCPRCRDKIFGLNPRTGRKGPLPNQCQFKVLLSNGSITEIGLCKGCFATIKDEEIEEIFEGIKKYWLLNGYEKPLLEQVKISKIMKDTVW